MAIDIECYCRKHPKVELGVSLVTGSHGWNIEPFVSVEPCESCLEEAREEGRKEEREEV